jgi:hypothetical protein
MTADTTLPASDPDYEAAVRGKYLAGNVGIEPVASAIVSDCALPASRWRRSPVRAALATTGWGTASG